MSKDNGGTTPVTQEQLKAALKESAEWLAHLVVNEMGNRFAEVSQRLDRIESRLDRQAGLIQTGSR